MQISSLSKPSVLFVPLMPYALRVPLIVTSFHRAQARVRVPGRRMGGRANKIRLRVPSRKRVLSTKLIQFSPITFLLSRHFLRFRT